MTEPAGRTRAGSREFRRPGGEPVLGLGRSGARIVPSADPACPGVEFGPTSHDESACTLSAVAVEFEVDARMPCCFGGAPDGNVVNVPIRQ